MIKLIATVFKYTMLGREYTGSYLGRKTATRDTIRRFLTANTRTCHSGPVQFGRIVTSYQTDWIAR